MRRATERMSAKATDDKLVVSFEDKTTNAWDLPRPSDKMAVTKIFGDSAAWAREHGATDGQLGAIRKALNSAGYYLTGPVIESQPPDERIVPWQ